MIVDWLLDWEAWLEALVIGGTAILVYEGLGKLFRKWERGS